MTRSKCLRMGIWLCLTQTIFATIGASLSDVTSLAVWKSQTVTSPAPPRCWECTGSRYNTSYESWDWGGGMWPWVLKKSDKSDGFAAPLNQEPVLSLILLSTKAHETSPG